MSFLCSQIQIKIEKSYIIIMVIFSIMTSSIQCSICDESKRDRAEAHLKHVSLMVFSNRHDLNLKNCTCKTNTIEGNSECRIFNLKSFVVHYIYGSYIDFVLKYPNNKYLQDILEYVRENPLIYPKTCIESHERRNYIFITLKELFPCE